MFDLIPILISVFGFCFAIYALFIIPFYSCDPYRNADKKCKAILKSRKKNNKAILKSRKKSNKAIVCDDKNSHRTYISIK